MSIVSDALKIENLKSNRHNQEIVESVVEEKECMVGNICGNICGKGRLPEVKERERERYE